MRKVFAALFGLVIFLFLSQAAHADSNFSTSFTGTYTVKDTGTTHANFSVLLKNLTDRYYASSYTIQLGFADIQNVHAYDSGGVILPTLKKTAAGQQLTFVFNHRATGLGSTVPFSFSFDTPNVATKNGSVWEVNIPGLQNQSDFSDFTVKLAIPASFGPLTYAKPDVGNNLTFSKTDLGQSGISLAFGREQVFHFNLSYHLKNTQLFPIRTEIALPPNTTYQDIALDSVEPKPLNVTKDGDGNWLATYSLSPSQVVTVHVDGRAFVSLTPKKEQLTFDEKAQDLKPTAYWQTNNDKIKQLGEELQTPYAIYEYVIKTLHYDFSRVSDNQERLGAVAVLQNPSSAVCLEFTDLFIALARAAGIPAREIDGFAYTQNSHQRPVNLQKDILHAWPEYYDEAQGTWVMVDPTWENTTGGVDYFHTFDFDHVAFVIKGKSPDYPVPAGGYKLLGEEKNQEVQVNFADNVSMPEAESGFDVLVPDTLVGGWPVAADIMLSNTGHVLFPSQKLHMTSTLPFLAAQDIDTPDVPPYGTAQVTAELGKSPFLTNKTGTVTIQLAGKSVSKPLAVVPFTLRLALIGGGIIIGSICCILFIVTRRSRRVSIS